MNQLLIPYFYKGIIYQIINIQNYLSYIGKTTAEDYLKYINNHFDDALINKDKYSKDFYKAIREYGKKNFKVIILGEIYNDNLKKFNEELNQAEIDCIYHFRTFGVDGIKKDDIYGYNMTPGGDGFWFGHKTWSKGLTKETHPSLIQMAENSSKSHKGMILINNGIKNKQIKKEIVNDYLESGWTIGRLMTNKTKHIVYMNNGKDNIRIPVSDKDYYLNNGYILGLVNWDFNKNRIRIFKNSNEKKIEAKYLSQYLNNGWELITQENKHLFAHKYRNKIIRKGEKNSSAKKYIVITPQGEEIFLHGKFTNFCKDNKLNQAGLRNVANGKIDNYKGWKCKKVE